MKNRHMKIAGIVAAAALAVPGATVAKKPDWAGKGKPEQAKGNGKGNAKGKGKAKGPKLAKANLKGSVVSAEGTVVTIAVTKANAHGKGCRGSELTFDISDARVRTADNNADGVRDAADVMAGHRVLVHASVPRIKGRKTACPLAEGVTADATRLVNKSRAAPGDEDGDEGEGEELEHDELDEDELD